MQIVLKFIYFFVVVPFVSTKSSFFLCVDKLSLWLFILLLIKQKKFLGYFANRVISLDIIRTKGKMWNIFDHFCFQNCLLLKSNYFNIKSASAVIRLKAVTFKYLCCKIDEKHIINEGFLYCRPDFPDSVQGLLYIVCLCNGVCWSVCLYQNEKKNRFYFVD